MNKPRLLINPVVQWAVEPGHQGSIEYVETATPPAQAVPYVGDVLTLPFMVDPITKQPCPVRVTRLEYQDHPSKTVVIPVVVRAHSD
jgi:hypothetical protein